MVMPALRCTTSSGGSEMGSGSPLGRPTVTRPCTRTGTRASARSTRSKYAPTIVTVSPTSIESIIGSDTVRTTVPATKPSPTAASTARSSMGPGTVTITAGSTMRLF